MKILTVVGARPQFIKAAPVSRALRRAHSEVLVHTGQHYDDTMSALFFRDLEIPAPEVNLQVGSGRHGAQTAEMIHRLEPVIEEHQPDGILVYGDTNSTLAAAVVACKAAYADGHRPWLAHVEAGLRSFNPNMPEERNRVVADHLSDLLLAPTPAAMQNLEREGLAERAELVGDVMVDAFEWAIPRENQIVGIPRIVDPGLPGQPSQPAVEPEEAQVGKRRGGRCSLRQMGNLERRSSPTQIARTRLASEHVRRNRIRA